MDDSKFDVIIIGAGVGGLTTAALLSTCGLKCCVLERHYLVGGYLQGFSRKGFHFDTAIHWLNQCGKDGTVNKVFDFIGPDYPKVDEMTTIHSHVTKNYTYKLTNNPDDFMKQLVRDFPHEEYGIKRFFNAAKIVANVSKKFSKFYVSDEVISGLRNIINKIYKLKIIFPIIPYALAGGNNGINKALMKYFKDPKLLDIFCSEPDLLSCLFPIAWAYNNDYQNRPLGGSREIPKWLESKIKANGSIIVTRAEVEQIEVSNNEFSSLIYKHKNERIKVSANFLVAACDLELLHSKLLPMNNYSNKILSKLNKSEMYSSSVTLSVALNCTAESLGFKDEMVYLYNSESTRKEHLAGDPHKSFISISAPSIRDKSLAPEGKGTLNIFVPAWISYKNNWGATINENGDYVRGESYKQIKNEFAQIILNRIKNEICRNIEEHIEFVEIATPITYYRYTRNKDGTMMGTRPGKTNMQLKVANYKTHIKNIYVSGHWAELGGGVPISVKAAFNSSLLVLKNSNKLKYNELLNYQKKW